MKVLVTGGAGLIGSHLVDLLIEKGYDVVIVDSLEKPTHLSGLPDWINKKAQFIKGDIRNDSILEKALKDVSIVFHQAAVGGFMPEIKYYVDVNCTGTAIMMEKIVKSNNNIKKLIIASSQAVYGEGDYNCSEHGKVNPDLRSIDQMLKKDWEVKCPICNSSLIPLNTQEESTTDGDTVYAVSKYFQEKLVLGLGKKYDLPTVALRYSMTYGDRQSISNPYTGVMSIFSTQIINDKPPVIFEDGLQMRDLVYVKDVAKANLFVAENEEITNDYFNVGTGKATLIMDLAKMLINAYGKNFEPHLTGEFRPGEVRHLFADCTKLKNYGFKPDTSVEEGINHYLEWIKEQSDIKEYFTKAISQLKNMKVVISAE